VPARRGNGGRETFKQAIVSRAKHLGVKRLFSREFPEIFLEISRSPPAAQLS